MKILLVNPPMERLTGVASWFFPLGLAYLASVLQRDEHEVHVYVADSFGRSSRIEHPNQRWALGEYINTLHQEHEAWNEFSNILQELQPGVVGITAYTRFVASSLKIASLCKKYNPQCKVIIGGTHATIQQPELLESEHVDFLIVGEGENTILQLVKYLDTRNTAYHEIDGLSYRRNGDVVHNKPRMLINNLDEIPIPSRDLLMGIENFTSEDMGVIITSRGCPYHCTYCACPKMWRGVRYRSIDNVIKEIQQVIQQYGTVQFAIYDDTFTINRQRVLEFCKTLIKEKININWTCTTRLDLLDDEQLIMMKKSGCNNVKVGVESGSPEILELMKKKENKDDIRHGATLLRKHGFFWSGYFMMGIPTETKEDILDTLEFMQELKPNFAQMSIFLPLPGTELFSLGLKLGLYKPKMSLDEFFSLNPDDYYFVDPNRRVTTMETEEFNKIRDYVFENFRRYNSRFSGLFARAVARRKAYINDPRLLLHDIKRAASLLKF